MPTYTAGKPETSEFYVPAGEYTLRVVEAKEDTSTNGNDMIVLTIGPIIDGKVGPKFTERLTFTEKAFWRVDQFLKACDQHPGEGKEINLKAEDTVGWEFKAELAIEGWTSKSTGKEGKSNTIKSYLWDEF